MDRSIRKRINVNIMVISRVKSVFGNQRKGAKLQGCKACCIASSNFSCAEAPAFSSHEPLVQQPAGQLFLNYNAVTLSGIKCPYLPDDLKDSLPTIEELEKELRELKEVEDGE